MPGSLTSYEEMECSPHSALPTIVNHVRFIKKASVDTGKAQAQSSDDD